jgi:hypothetical protein
LPLAIIFRAVGAAIFRAGNESEDPACNENDEPIPSDPPINEGGGDNTILGDI